MKEACTAKQLLINSDFIGKKVTIKGWVRSRRDSKVGISFLAVHDGSCFNAIQVIIKNDLFNYQSEVLKLTKDCAVEIKGTLVLSQGKGQSVEIQADHVIVHGWVQNPDTYPMSSKNHTMEHLREYAHLRIRTNIISCIARIRHNLAYSLHNFFHDQGFFWVNTPILTSNDCEGAGELFRVSTLDQLAKNNNSANHIENFFGKETFLTVSGQLNIETYCMAMSKVYTFGPTFRAENSNTSRHLAEFWMIEPEMAFSDLNDCIDLAEKMLKSTISFILKKCPDELNFFDKFVKKGLLNKINSIINDDFVRIEYTDAIKILETCGKSFEYPIKWGIDLQSEHERFLCEEYFQSPVVLMNYPKNMKAFYMRLNDDNKTVAAMDVLVPGIGEIIGGSQREERITILDKRISEKGVCIDNLSWYRDLRRYGTVPHCGFGLGFERLLSYVTGISNVRDVIPFPRTPGNINY